MSDPLVIHWFRQDLRLADNPSLRQAAAKGRVLPVYILDDVNAGRARMGGASRWWLHHSLAALNHALHGKLALFKGDPLEIIPRIVRSCGVTAVHWNRCYEPWRIRRDGRLKERLREEGAVVDSFNGSLLREPWEVYKADGLPYRVFTPYFRKGCLKAAPPRYPLPVPERLSCADLPQESLSLDALGLLPRIRRDIPLEPHWHIGEKGAAERFELFLKHGLPGYREGRDYPARPNVSRLSPSLHFGEISPNTAWYAAQENGSGQEDLDHFLSELAWREFSYSLLYYNPELPAVNLDASFNRFPWIENHEALLRWQHGMTGYPIVDAGMRELRQSGYMHNRVRMVTGSFLVKNLLVHWHEGESWFWNSLADADLAINSASWQWVAGCGADAAPYFRIFNPVTQAQKFDPDGVYLRRWLPELAALPDCHLFAPWEAPGSVLRESGITMGKTYPLPLVDLKLSRKQALDAYRLTRT